jgi:hypothetical protein
VLALLADLAAGRATSTPNGHCEGMDADEPDRMTDAQADRAYALDADYAAAAMFS